MIAIGNLVITDDDTLNFARLSGDHNPLHVDPVAARRFQFGNTVIHGVHGTLLALDALFKHLSELGNKRIDSISVVYSKPVKQGDQVEVLCNTVGELSYKIEVLNGGKKAQVIKVSLAEVEQVFVFAPYEELKTSPRPLTLAEAEELTVEFPLTWNNELCASLFPHLYKNVPNGQIAYIMGLTNIVGMRCPGMDSVFAGFKAAFKQMPEHADAQLTFTVSTLDPRFSRVVMDANNNVADGQIEALFRPQQVAQPDMAFIQSLTPSQLFSGVNALVVGGSRGLGETAAKILAAGGAKVTVSYARGQGDAEAIAKDICQHEGKASTMQLNVLDVDQQTELSIQAQGFTHIFYFASPLIEKNDDLFDVALFNKFCSYYVTGLAKIVNAIAADKARRKEQVTLFIPSTVFIEESKKGFAEYVTAKQAAEQYVEHTLAKLPKWKAVVPRMKPMLTDQTAAVVSVSVEENVKELLSLLEPCKSDEN